MFVPDELRLFFGSNPMLYGNIGADDLEQLIRIQRLFPDKVRLLRDIDAVELIGFNCMCCGECCSRVKYIPVCLSDIKKWLAGNRFDILGQVVIDRRVTPLIATCGKDAIEEAKWEARKVLDTAGIFPGQENVHYGHILELSYMTMLLENVAYVKRKDGHCVFLSDDDDVIKVCAIHGVKPRVCEKFPYYTGKYTDKKLIRDDIFCPSLREAGARSCSKEAMRFEEPDSVFLYI
ncbi:YkgJ family cysteine cluster protein [Methanooceanicella nereidis]|uniref:YkgJ family cysteine cluster protein n=1 Tax=Methanooceanicella nereidis TaxID=2052831 RepID=UPI001E53FB05|nr:YkgJ family cysteine cluster protein [Methanocella sp. CWC-04]